jgi:hypothetical protein
MDGSDAQSQGPPLCMSGCGFFGCVLARCCAARERARREETLSGG